MFNALVLHKDDAGFRAGVESLADERLPALGEGDVKVAIEYSTLNYKDGLALTNKGPVVRIWPMVPGIDGAGTRDREPPCEVARRRSRRAQRLGRRRDALGLPGRARGAARRRPGAITRGIQREAGDGDRHGGLHRDALRAGDRSAWRQAQ